MLDAKIAPTRSLLSVFANVWEMMRDRSYSIATIIISLLHKSEHPNGRISGVGVSMRLRKHKNPPIHYIAITWTVTLKGVTWVERNGFIHYTRMWASFYFILWHRYTNKNNTNCLWTNGELWRVSFWLILVWKGKCFNIHTDTQ